MPQDMPPTGGYEPIQYKRNIPTRGIRPGYAVLVCVGIMTYGFYKYGVSARERKWV